MLIFYSEICLDFPLKQMYWGGRVGGVFNPIFNNILVISRQSGLLVEEIGALGENHRPATSHWQTLSYNIVLRVHIAVNGIRFELTTLVVIGAYCIGSYKSNSPTITTAPITNVLVSTNLYRDPCTWYMIKFVNDLWWVGGFLRVLRFPPLIKLTAKI
jgi:hypothetical protein